MSGRGTGQPPFELPAWIVELAEAEGEPFEVRSISGRLHQAGVRDVVRAGDDESQPAALAATGPALDVRIDIRWSEDDAPITAALAELVDYLEHYGPLIQLHVASTDMELVALAAHELARYRHVLGGAEQPVHSPYTVVAEVLETGIVAMYARSFTGRARLGDGWRPKAAADLYLHGLLMQARKTYVHADWTDTRTLVDTNAMLGHPGPPIIAEQRAQIGKERLLAIADLAERQGARFLEEAGRLKMRLGVANAPWPIQGTSETQGGG